MKTFVKGMDKIGRVFEHLRNKLPNVSDAKIKEGVFIRELMQDKQFDEDLNETEKMHGFNLRGFSRISEEITKQRTIMMLCRTC